MPKPLLILTLPHTLSGWLVDAVRDHTDHRYQPEYFSPLENPRHERRLANLFGSPLIDSYAHICTEPTGGDLVHIDDTWGQDDLTFTTSAYNPLKLASFQKRFDVIVFTRSQRNLFEHASSHVFAEYERIWWSLHERAHWADYTSPTFQRTAESRRYELGATCSRSRALEAHHVCTTEMAYDAHRFEAPVIDLEDLLSDSPAYINAVLSLTTIPNTAAVARDLHGRELKAAG